MMGNDRLHAGYGWLVSVATTPRDVQRKLQPLIIFPGTASASQPSGGKWEGEGMERFHDAFRSAGKSDIIVGGRTQICHPLPGEVLWFQCSPHFLWIPR